MIPPSVCRPGEAEGAGFLGAHVDNVIGVLPGRDPRLPALALMAHHDSVPGSPGAADDITGVADALEITRAIKARGRPERDVMLVFTDGEEADLIGATAFFADDQAAKHVGFVINLEARGGGGRATMFETGPGNGAAIDLSPPNGQQRRGDVTFPCSCNTANFPTTPTTRWPGWQGFPA